MRCEYIILSSLVIAGECTRECRASKISNIGFCPSIGHSIYLIDSDMEVEGCSWDDEQQQLDIWLEDSNTPFTTKEEFEGDIDAMRSYGWDIEIDKLKENN